MGLLIRACVPPLCEAHDEAKSVINLPLVGRLDVAHTLAKSARVNGTKLLDKDVRRLTLDLDLGTECCGPGASGRRSDYHDRTRQEYVRLKDNPEPATFLLVTFSSRLT